MSTIRLKIRREKAKDKKRSKFISKLQVEVSNDRKELKEINQRTGMIVKERSKMESQIRKKIEKNLKKKKKSTRLTTNTESDIDGLKSELSELLMKIIFLAKSEVNLKNFCSNGFYIAYGFDPVSLLALE